HRPVRVETDTAEGASVRGGEAEGVSEPERRDEPRRGGRVGDEGDDGDAERDQQKRADFAVERAMAHTEPDKDAGDQRPESEHVVGGEELARGGDEVLERSL